MIICPVEPVLVPFVPAVLEFTASTIPLTLNSPRILMYRYIKMYSSAWQAENTNLWYMLHWLTTRIIIDHSQCREKSSAKLVIVKRNVGVWRKKFKRANQKRSRWGFFFFSQLRERISLARAWGSSIANDRLSPSMVEITPRWHNPGRNKTRYRPAFVRDCSCHLSFFPIRFLFFLCTSIDVEFIFLWMQFFSLSLFFFCLFRALFPSLFFRSLSLA